MLHDDGKVDEALDRLRNKGLVYESDGALWFRSSDLGDDKDRVLVRRTVAPPTSPAISPTWMTSSGVASTVSSTCGA